MAIRNSGFYATVWEVRHPEGKNYTEAKISTSAKNAEGKYETDCNIWARFINTAKAVVDSLTPGKDARIHVTDFSYSNSYSKEKQKEYHNWAIFSCEVASFNGGTQKPATTQKTDFTSIPSDVSEDGLPFD